MKKLIFYLLALWLALLPWHAFLKTWTASLFLGSNADFLPITSNVASLWKEILLIIILFCLFILTRREKIFLNKSLLVGFGAYILSIIIWGGASSPSLSAFILGLRTDLLFLVALAGGYYAAHFLEAENIQKLLKVLTISLILCFSIFLLFWIFIPNIGLHFGYSPYQSSYVENKPLPIYHCIFLGDSCLPRLQASAAGPNQAASLAILLLGLLAILPVHPLFFTLPFLALFLTFSRSAFVGTIIALFTQLTNKWKLRVSLGLLVILSILFALAPAIITHGLSSLEHWEKTTDGIQRILQQPWGSGLGSVGPVARRLFGENNALISENWYLQIGEEAGIVTMFLLILLTIGIIKNLLSSKNKFSKVIGAVLLATSIQALFLHLWEDSVVTMLIWFWVGVGLCYNTNETI